jgi:hypothetical protein
MMTPQKLRAFYNTHFFNEEGEEIPAQASIVIRIQQDELEIPGIRLQAGHTIEDLIKAYYSFLLDNPIQKDTPPVSQPLQQASSFLNVEQFTYRDNLYLVEEHKDDTFVVVNNGSGKKLNPQSPVYRALVKKYRKALTS